MSFIRIWVHLIWSTKNRERIIHNELRSKLIDHIKINCKEKGIWLDSVNCVSDHIHLLISLNADVAISKSVMLIKGESSHWVNKNNFVKRKFQWQDEYIAISVSESMVDKVRDYIRNQETHHKRKSFTEEYEAFVKKYEAKVN